MATSDVQNNAIAAPVSQPVADGSAERTYPMSRAGRRQAILLLLGVVSIWIFALWTLVTILQDGVNGAEWVSLLLMVAILVIAPEVAWTFLEEANSRISTTDEGVRYQTIGGINLSYRWEEVQGPKGKEGRSRLARFFLGDDDAVDITNNVSTAEASKPRPGEAETAGEMNVEAVADGAQVEVAQSSQAAEQDNADSSDDDEEPETTLVRLSDNHAAQISNPLLRFLHSQAHGQYLPIYGGLEKRRELLQEITRRKRET